MPRLLVLSGLPGSGKSTEAARLASVGMVIVGRDELRIALVNVKDESLLTELMADLTRNLLANQYDVVVDAWNLHPADYVRWTDIALETNAQLEWRQMDTPVDECIRRDALRPNPNGAERIREVAKEFSIG